MHLLELNRLSAVGKGTQSSSTRGPSNLVWKDCPWFELRAGLKDGFAEFDDFLAAQIQAANVAAASTTLKEPWAAFTDSTAGSTIASGISPSDAVGTMVLASTTTQEGLTCAMLSARNTNAPVSALSATNRFWMETRIKASSVTTEEIAFFVGLAIVGRAITLGCIATGGAATATVDNVGFLYKAAATTAISTVYGNSNANTLAATGVLAADTYTKLGMYWNGATMTFYQDGAALADQLPLATSSFPAGANLGPYIAMQDGTGASDNLVTVDWVRVAFERTSDVGT